MKLNLYDASQRTNIPFRLLQRAFLAGELEDFGNGLVSLNDVKFWKIQKLLEGALL